MLYSDAEGPRQETIYDELGFKTASVSTTKTALAGVTIMSEVEI